jgi:hypothetical protein
VQLEAVIEEEVVEIAALVSDICGVGLAQPGDLEGKFVVVESFETGAGGGEFASDQYRTYVRHWRIIALNTWQIPTNPIQSRRSVCSGLDRAVNGKS